MSGKTFELLGVTEELSEENAHFYEAIKEGCEYFKRTNAIFTSEDWRTKAGWTLEVDNKKYGNVYSTKCAEGKIFAVHYEIQTSLDQFVFQDWSEVEKLPEIKEQVQFSKILHHLTPNCDIIHYATKKVFLITGRDYVSVRLRRRANDAVFTLAHGVDHILKTPETGEHVRGRLHFSAGYFRASPNAPETTTIVDTLLCIDLGGNLPASLMNTQMAKALLKEAESDIKRAQSRTAGK